MLLISMLGMTHPLLSLHACGAEAWLTCPGSSQACCPSLAAKLARLSAPQPPCFRWWAGQRRLAAGAGPGAAHAAMPSTVSSNWLFVCVKICTSATAQGRTRRSKRASASSRAPDAPRALSRSVTVEWRRPPVGLPAELGGCPLWCSTASLPLRAALCCFSLVRCASRTLFSAGWLLTRSAGGGHTKLSASKIPAVAVSGRQAGDASNRQECLCSSEEVLNILAIW